MRTATAELIVIMGLTDDPQRFAYKAGEKLQRHGFQHLIGIHPKGGTVLGIPVVRDIHAIQQSIHTLTLYIGPSKSAVLSSDILKAHPQRIIFNPGTENEALAAEASRLGIEVIEGCTLVMLSQDAF